MVKVLLFMAASPGSTLPKTLRERIFGGNFKVGPGSTGYFARKFSVAKLMPSSWQ